MSHNTVQHHKPWMQPYQKKLKLLVSHQDQVDQLPGQAEVLGGSDFCPNYFIQYNDHFLSIQGHPEFTKDYSKALIEARRGKTVPEETAQQALASLAKDTTDSELVARWLLNFMCID